MVLKYSDKEVEQFHPICQRSLEEALRILGKADSYGVEHHRQAGTLEMDFAVTNRSSGRVVCVIEVKRTPSAVKSSRYQYQAMSYLQQLPPAMIERPYYIITNIECSCMFKFDASRPNVHQQMLSPGIVGNVGFSDIESKSALVGHKSRHFAELLETAFNGSGRYLDGVNVIVSMLSAAANRGKAAWNSLFARMSYEYIRGAFDGIGRKTGLKDIRQYAQRIPHLCAAMSKIDFAGIFALSRYDELPVLKAGVLSDIYALGKANVDADELVSALHQTVSDGFEGDGEVATDIELGRLMSVVARHLCPTPAGTVCDPAAGSGNLLSCLCEAYPEITPSQIKANDRKPVLRQLLTLRLGLKFPGTVAPGNAPTVTGHDITDLAPEYFEDVRLMMMNPPMVASISCGAERAHIYDRIRQLGYTPATDTGQPPLEAAFIELANTLAKEGTVSVALLPRTHLTALGPAAVALRRFLLDDFGLSLIFNYPGIGLFENVTKDTVMIAGRKGDRPERIAMLCTLDPVADTDLAAVAELLAGETDGCNGGLECIYRSRAGMEAAIADGWATGDSLTIEMSEFFNRHFDHSPAITRLGSLNTKIYRGKVGNKGISDLLFLTPDKEPYTIIPHDYRQMLSPAMRNARTDEAELTVGDSLFPNARLLHGDILESIVDHYVATTPRQGRQRRDFKPREAIIDILHTEADNSCAANSILLPRDLRRYGRVYRCTRPTFVSTNFFVIEDLDNEDSRLLASWMTTIFFQLSCELFGKNQEGTRKMERGELYRTHIPRLTLISENDKARILGSWPTETFIDLQNPEIRQVDIIWAEAIFGGQGHEILAEAADMLLRKATVRNN